MDECIRLLPDFNKNCKYRVAVPSKFSSSIGIPFLEILDENNQRHKLKISSSVFVTIEILPIKLTNTGMIRIKCY